MGFYNKKDGIFDRFFNRRSELIIQLANGELSKKEFLEYNYDLVRRANMSPFLRIDNYEMGMYNYQYYNVLAKYFNMLAGEAKDMGKNHRQINDYANRSNNYYNEKDKATVSLLEYLDFKGIDAYYIEMESKSLNGKLYEIVLLDYDKAIFHSKSEWLLDILKEKGVFKNKKKRSIIDNYINETY